MKTIWKKNCPTCRGNVEVSEEYMGLEVACPLCHQVFTPSHAESEGAERGGIEFHKWPGFLCLALSTVAVIALGAALVNSVEDEKEKAIIALIVSASSFMTAILLGIWSRLISIDETLKRK